MEVRRYRKKADDTNIAVSNQTLPAFLILILGVVISIVGIILFAAFGMPNDVLRSPKQLSGPSVLALGLLLSVGAIMYAVRLNKPKIRTVTPSQPKRMHNENVLYNMERKRQQGHPHPMEAKGFRAPMARVDLIYPCRWRHLSMIYTCT